MYDLIIVGTGPSGLTAALYALRANLKVLLIEKNAPGGRLLNTHLIENYPGFESISGSDLALKMFNQVTKIGAEVIFDEIIEILPQSNHIHLVKTKNSSYKTKSIYISAGMRPKLLDVEGINKFFGNGVSTCVICDGAFHRNKPIAMIGGGNAAAEESLFASKLASKVYIININSNLNAEPITIEKINKIKNIEVLNNAKTLSINGDEKLNSITIEQNGIKKDIEVSGVFLYIGNNPNNEFVLGLDLELEKGFIKVDKNNATSIPGIYAGGDVIHKKYRQITTSISDGTISALEIEKYIDINFNEK